MVAAPPPLEYTSDMQAVAENGLMLALFNLGGGEIILVLAIVIILFSARKLPLCHLLCLCAIVGCVHQNFTQASLAGTWVSQWTFIWFTNTIAPDGSYVCDRVHTITNGVWLSRTVDVQMRGTWKIENGLLVNTTTNITGSSRVKTVPVAYGHILRADADELVIKWDNNGTNSVWKRER